MPMPSSARGLQPRPKLGPVDILLAFAGGGTAMPASVDQTAEDDWRSGIDHNLTATFLTLKAFLPGMKERRAGAIVTMASTADGPRRQRLPHMQRRKPA